ncbi:hypothetical protein Q3G72_023728 [Acer saccharum]|nr:hypothetical protein Q3G72_023728 [Acer saccharum]
MAGTGGIAQRWRELSGENNWEGLLDPLDIDLRRYIIHYGARTAAVGDPYNGDKGSNMSRFFRYPPNNFFSELGTYLQNPPGWGTYVAVATDEGKTVLGRRDILICWRGTWTDLGDIFGDNPHRDAKVHMGFHSIYTAKSPSSRARSPSSKYNKTSAIEQVLISEVWKLVDKYKDEEISITVTGHSLGAALATMTGVDIASNGYNKPSTNNKEGKACPLSSHSHGIC